ncbi:unnamed protein product, partial [Vitis vinifera]|uniref:Uncharacterized protein n=1 Tax=Vitis vinifera TaxID=29760 RepID=D7TYM1_VITVI
MRVERKVRRQLHLFEYIVFEITLKQNYLL